MNDDFQVSIEDVLSAVRKTETFALFFPVLRRTLLVDLRSDAATPPFVRLVPMARSAEERLQYVRRMRPRLPPLESLAVIPWARYAESLVTSGVFALVLERLAGTGDAAAVRAAQDALRELQRLEQAELVAAVRGENYRTLWENKGG